MSRRLDALRALAERPGTPEEGEVARRMLAKLQPATSDTVFARMIEFEVAKLSDLIKKSAERPLTPEEKLAFWDCACGRKDIPLNEKCQNVAEHIRIKIDVTLKFPIGTKVFVNAPLLPANLECTVSRFAGWNQAWIKTSSSLWERPVNVYDQIGWHLSLEPLAAEEARRLGARCGY